MQFDWEKIRKKWSEWENIAKLNNSYLLNILETNTNGDFNSL